MPLAGTDDRDDGALVAAARAGDREAFATLVGRHRPLALALVMRLLGRDDVAADAVQEAAVTALVGLDRLRVPDRFGPWFAGIALNVARRWRREALRPAPLTTGRSQGWSGGETPGWIAPGPGPDEVVEAADLAGEVEEAVSALAAGQREAVLAFYWGDRSHQEAAAELGISAGAVKARLHQARANLQPRLAHHVAATARTGAARSGCAPKEDSTMPTRATVPSDQGWIAVEVADVRRSTSDTAAAHTHAVVLRDREGDRLLPIYIGAAEATALACSLESVETPRPMTYAMAAGLVHATGARVLDVRITRLAEQTFYALIHLDGPEGPAEVDARPSDALNLALVAGVPVLVQASLFEVDADIPEAGHWHTAWQGFPSAAPAIATEVRAHMAAVHAQLCAGPEAAGP